MKTSVYSLSLPDKNPAQIIELATKYGCDGIEWWCREKGHINTEKLETSAREVARLMTGSRLKSAALAPYFQFRETKDEVKALFGAAVILGAKNIRCHSYLFTGETPYAELLKKQRGWLESTVIPVAEEYNLRLLIEQHFNMICCTPNACLDLVEGFPANRVGIIFDPGNSQVEGYTRPEYALSIFGDYLGHVHVKSCKSTTGGEQPPAGRKFPIEWVKLIDGDLDWKLIIQALHKYGYRNFLSLEALDRRDSEQKLKDDIPYLKHLIDEIRNM